MPRKGVDPGLPRSLPGPLGSGAGPLPPLLPAGVLPSEDSRLWHFDARAVQQGEGFIQDDTRDWFEDRDRKVVISRSYPDHPRWLLNDGVRARMHNYKIVSEVHMLARVTAGLSDVPAWVPARMSVKQQQSDVGFRLLKLTREQLIVSGKDAMAAFAQRAPGQFLKFVATVSVPRQIEANVTQSAGTVMDPETADALLAAIAEELGRRQDEMKEIAVVRPLDYEPPVDVVDAVKDVAKTFHAATEPARALGSAKNAHPSMLTDRLSSVIDLEADVVEPQTEWD